MFAALRDCNTFLERMKTHIPDLQEYDQKRWIAEVKFLKAYYHYWLLRMYGPIPLIKENLPVSANVEEVQVYRDPVDDCFDYIVSLLNEAAPDLPLIIQNEATENGRASQPMALALKAKVLVEAASPLFNGNTDYAGFKRKDGVQYFNQTYDAVKWEKAALACRNAIDTCHLAGFALHYYQPGLTENLPPELITQMSIRTAVTEGNYDLNDEMVWNNSMNSSATMQSISTPNLSQAHVNSNYVAAVELSPPLKIAEMFYTDHGVPMNEDKEWELSGKYRDRYSVKTAAEDSKYNIGVGFQTAILHFNREPRFYANLSFDGNLFYGISNYNVDNQWLIRAKSNEFAGKRNIYSHSVTGYFPKKLANHKNTISGSLFNRVDYNWPVIRLADLYLLFSEAANEAYGPSHEDAHRWIDLVRERAGLEGVVASWAKYAGTQFNAKPTTKDGLRNIIQQERLIELANEGHRYWDIRRWKRGREMWHNQPIQCWDVDQAETATYYRVRTLFTPLFTTKDYFWPIRESDLVVNSNLDQNPGW
ncbi:MAG: RagB/SusD family nutrient uptake outer membrane protein [Bacteroidales bacterium]|nr:RagB/SusD family nutrient uptake outer membrane protein [Bacteroidales bacterium]